MRMATRPPHPDEELVSRGTQAGFGLLTAVVVYGTALGGLFSLAFALVYGRWEALGPRGTAALLAAVGFVSLYLVPFFKYPPNPPAVGNPDTIGMRTGLYVTLLALSLAGMIAAQVLRGRLAPRQGRWNASLWAGGAYLVGMVVVGLLLPAVQRGARHLPGDDALVVPRRLARRSGVTLDGHRPRLRPAEPPGRGARARRAG